MYDYQTWSTRLPGYSEGSTWTVICLEDALDCRGDLAETFASPTSFADGSATLAEDKSILVETAADASPGVSTIRSLSNPQSMRGASLDEFRALVDSAGLIELPGG